MGELLGERSLFPEGDGPMTGSYFPENDQESDLSRLARRVRNGELPQMTSGEADALDEAIEMGLITEAELRGPGYAA